MNNTQYIVDAIKNGDDRVKIVVDGIVTEANAKEALEQFYKPVNARKHFWKDAQPYEPVFFESTREMPIVPEEELTINEEEVINKKNKKQKIESDES